MQTERLSTIVISITPKIDALLSHESKEAVLKWAKNMRSTYEKTRGDMSFNKERQEHYKLISRLLSRENVMRLTESDFKKIIKELWAFRMWSNKDHPANNILQNSGIKKIRASLNNLLYGSEPLEKRFDNFHVKYFATASITEIMAIMHPHECGLWNSKPRKYLSRFKIDQISPQALKYGKISGTEYVKYNQLMKEIADILFGADYEKMNLLDLDTVIWLTPDKIWEKSKHPSPPPPPPKMTHWDAIGMITEIGNALEFETYVADPNREYGGRKLQDISTQKEVPEQCTGIVGIELVDAIWVGFEPPIYLFEVEDKGTMREALLRLYQAKFLDARFLVVCPAGNRGKFDKYVNNVPFKECRQRYQFRSFDELRRMHDAVMGYHKVRSLFLAKSDSRA